jgi:aminoglycoside 6-adenylyltransferase
MEILSYDTIRQRFCKLCEASDDVGSSLVFGSQANSTIRSDEWSDLDLLTFCDEPILFLENQHWLSEIGEIQISFCELNVFGCGIEVRVLFDGGYDVDFLFFPSSEIAQILSSTEVASWIKKGSEVIVDKNGKLAPLIRAVSYSEQSKYQDPSSAEYTNLVGDFYFHTVWTVKKYLRGELLTAKNCCDGYMKELLMRMAMWHTRSRNQDETFGYYGSRYFEVWAEPWIRRGLSTAYAYYDNNDLIRSLDSTSRLFSRVAKETAELLLYKYPSRYEEYSQKLIKEYLGSV